MKIWAAEADTAMRNVDNEYISFKMQMDNQQQRADNLHATMKEEIMKKDQVRLKLMKEASLADGPTLHFNQNDIIEKNWHKDEPEQVYTLESLGLEDAQEAAEVQDDRDAGIKRFKEQNEPNHNDDYTNDWKRLLDIDKPMRRADNADSPFTVAGVQALKEKAKQENKELNCKNALQDVCFQPNVENTHCKASPSFRDGCRLACGLCPDKEETKKFQKENKRKQESVRPRDEDYLMNGSSVASTKGSIYSSSQVSHYSSESDFSDYECTKDSDCPFQEVCDVEGFCEEPD
jgi:hypothetical protein